MTKVTSAVILAAGLGSRLPSFSKNLPKGFLPIDGVPIIERSIRNLINAGIEKIIIGTGYKSEAYENLMTNFPEIVCKRNMQYSSTGSMFTLYNLRNLVSEDFLLLESDLLYDKAGLESILNHPNKNIILVSGRTGAGDEVFIEVDDDRNLVSMSKNEVELGPVYGELTGISKISQSTFRTMNQYAEQNFDKSPGLDYEYALVGISNIETIYGHKIEDYAWCEIDDQHHLNRAQKVVWPRINQRGG